MKNNISYSKILFWTGTISLVLVYIISWTEMIGSPSQRTGTDFIAFFTAGHIAQEHGANKVYDIELQQKVQEDLLGFSLHNNQALLYNHLPFLIPLLTLIVQENYTHSFFIWLLILGSLYGLSFYILAKLLPKNWTMNTRRNYMISGVLFFPIFVSLLVGQDTAFLFLGLTLFTYGILRNKDFPAGAGLALSLVRPHLTLVLAIPVFFKNKKVFGYFAGLGTLLALLSFGILGIEGTQDFIRILTISGEGRWYGMKEATMFNLIGLLSRTFSNIDPGGIQYIGWAFYFFSIIFLSRLWKLNAKAASSSLGLSIIFSLFFAPHLHFHDLGLLLFPLTLVFLFRKISFPQDKYPLILLAISYILIFTKSTPYLYYSLPYILFLGIICLIYCKKGIAFSQISK